MTRLALSLLVIATVAKPARADESAPVSPLVTTAPDPFARWYGWQTMIADVAGIAASVGCVKLADSDSVTPACFTFFVAASPGVHFAHGNPGRGLLSFGLNLGLPLAGGALGAALSSCRGDDLCGSAAVVYGGLAGLLVAMTIDAAMAFDDEAPRQPPRRLSWLQPTVSITPQGGGVGLGGRF
jgi:hypothetical protein